VLPAFGNSQDLSDIEERLAKAPDDLSLLFARACTLDMLGRNDKVRDAYIAVIRRDGTHAGARGNLGTLLYNAGYRSAAAIQQGQKRFDGARDGGILGGVYAVGDHSGYGDPSLVLGAASVIPGLNAPASVLAMGLDAGHTILELSDCH
jgi:hypothetical protein